MSKLRLAGQLGKWLKSGGEMLAGPASLGRGEQLANLAYRFGPELGYAAMNAGVVLPPGTSTRDRLAVFLEDALIGSGLSVAGVGSGNLLVRGLKMQNPRNAQRVITGTDMAFGLGNLAAGPMGLRPQESAVYRKAAEQSQALQGLQPKTQDEALLELLTILQPRTQGLV